MYHGKEAAYTGMVHPVLEYGSSVLDPNPKKNLKDRKGSKLCIKVCDKKCL